MEESPGEVRIRELLRLEHLFTPFPPQTVTSLSSIRIDRDDLAVGQNFITLTVTGLSGVSRTYRLSLYMEPREACLEEIGAFSD